MPTVNNQIKFVPCTEFVYENLSVQDADTIYFLTDAKKICVGSNAYSTNIDDIYIAIDGALSGDPNYLPSLLLDDDVNSTYNPNGHLMLYYVDSAWTRHNLYDFSLLLANYTQKVETTPTSTVGFDVNGIPKVILTATSFSAGACTDTTITKLFVPNTVTLINGGSFVACTSLTEVYIDNTATGLTVDPSAFPNNVTIHYNTDAGRITFNAVDELINAVHNLAS